MSIIILDIIFGSLIITMKKHYLFITVFFSGMTSLAVEMSASRLIGNVFGSSNLVYVKRPTFSWDPVTGAVSYQVRIYTDAGQTLVRVITTAGNTVQSDVDLTIGQEYRYRERFSKASGATASASIID